MAHPYKAAAHKQDPKWVKGLETDKQHNVYQQADLQADLQATLRDRTANPKATAQAAYTKKGK